MMTSKCNAYDSFFFLIRIRVVFKWLMRAFSGHLPPEELLVLWDLVSDCDVTAYILFLSKCKMK